MVIARRRKRPVNGVGILFRPWTPRWAIAGYRKRIPTPFPAPVLLVALLLGSTWAGERDSMPAVEPGRQPSETQATDDATRTALERWRPVESRAREVLQQIARSDTSDLRALARRWQPERANPQELDTVITELRALLEQQAAVGGPDAVLLLARICAHNDRLLLAEWLCQGLLAHCQALPPQDPVFYSHVLSQLASIEGTLGRSGAAETHYRAAIDVVLPLCADTGTPATPSMWEALATSCDELGYLQSQLGNYRDGKSECLRAAKYWQQCAADDQHKTRAQRGLVRTLLHLIAIEMAQGEHRAAIAGYQELRDWLRQSAGSDDPALTELHYLLAECYLADAHWPMADRLQRAADHARQAARIAQLYGDRRGGRIARHYLAEVDFQRGRSFERQNSNQSRQLWEQSFHAWSELLAEHQTAGDRIWEGRTLRSLGDVQYARHEFESAGDYYRAAIARLDQAGAPPITGFNARMGQARVLAQQQHYAAATRCLGQAIQRIEIAGIHCTGSALRHIEFYERFSEASDLLVKCELADGHVADMLFCTEQFRNHLLWDELQRSESGIDPLQFLPSWQRQEFAEVQRRLNGIYVGQPQPGGASPPQDTRALEAQLMELWTKACEKTPYYHKLRPPTRQPAEFRELLGQLQQQHDITLYYYLGDEAGYLCVISDQTLRSYPLEISPAQSQLLFQNPAQQPQPLTCALASQLVDDFNRMLENDGHRRLRAQGGNSGTTHPGLQTAAAVANDAPESTDGPVRGLGEILPGDSPRLPWGRRPLPPAKLQPFGTKQALALSEILVPREVLRLLADHRRTHRTAHTILVADPALHRLPFQALPVRPGRGESASGPSQPRVVDRFPPICYAPSIQVLSLLQARSSNQRPGRYDLTVGGASADLTMAKEECRAFATRFPNQAVRPLLIGPRATEGLLRLYAPQCRLLHFADHAEFRAELSNLTGSLTLYRSPLRGNPPGDNDGSLNLLEIYDLKLDACEAVILNACRTGQGPATQLDSGQSLARAFLVAGAPRVIATFFEVPDAYACPLMKSVFADIDRQSAAGSTIDYAAALHRAVIDARTTAPPYAWASFALIGPPLAHRDPATAPPPAQVSTADATRLAHASAAE